MMNPVRTDSGRDKPAELVCHVS